jgi:hypothetical protein
VATHSPELAARAERCIELRDGRIAEDRPARGAPGGAAAPGSTDPSGRAGPGGPSDPAGP